ncbi:hypothetical protein GCM10023081_18720 [Arthrobacter ginkgonis]|uniref:Uncharacterized protein n=1 Tax=Arthrobacter ginkgonis TaxID=1630594 RepID=A0ABP7C7E5_9MICC
MPANHARHGLRRFRLNRRPGWRAHPPVLRPRRDGSPCTAARSGPDKARRRHRRISPYGRIPSYKAQQSPLSALA